jgi:hypothetical protein
VTAFEDDLASLRDSAERMGTALTSIVMHFLTDPRVMSATERVQREVRQARAVGQLAVMGVATKLQPPPPAAPEGEREPVDVPHVPSGIPGYSDLSASQIIPLLRALTDAERDEVRQYEQATRRRKTIMSALAPPQR